MSFLRIASVTAVILAGGCVFDEGDVETSEVEQAAICGWACGENSPVIPGIGGFHELNELGAANAEGFRISKFERYGTSYQLNVSRGKLIGRSLDGGASISGVALEDAVIWLRHPGGTFVLKVMNVGVTPMFADNNGDATPNLNVETYEIHAAAVDAHGTWGPLRNVCSNPPIDRVYTLGMLGQMVVLFDGDRIDGATKTVYGIDNNWFNIGCAGGALSKLYLTGHAEPAKYAPYNYVTDLAQRQTMLKMFSADYCGTGKAFTVGGQKVQWKDDLLWMKYDPQYNMFTSEARWTPNGASCLGTPRIEAHPTALSEYHFGDNVLPAIAAECGGALPQCWGGPFVFNGHHIVTANAY